jgi:hypothetical protein
MRAATLYICAALCTVTWPAIRPAIPLASVPQQGQVEGEVVQVFPTVIVIRDDQGHATILQITPRTQVGGNLKPGDKVVAYVTQYGVSSIQLKPPSTALIP